MAEIFKRAYDEVNRRLNGSGLSSIVYRQGGGSTIGRGLKRAYRGLPSTAKFYLEQFQDKPMTDKEVKETLTESEINELNKAIERNQASPKGGKWEIIDKEGEPTGFFRNNPTIPGPVKDEEGNILFDPEGQVTWDTPDYSQRGYRGIYDFFPGDPLFNLQNTMGQFYYGPANLAGEREIYDRYNWHMGDPEGLQGALNRGDLKWFLETAGKAYQDYKGREGRPISFTVNPYKDQWKFNPKTGKYIYPEGQGPSQQNTGEDHSLSSLEGYSEETSPSGVTTSFIDDMAIDTTSGLKHGGQTMPGGLSNLKKSININGQPHSLAWIRPDEASALKAMGGTGQKGPLGIPSYQWGDYPTDDQFDEAGMAEIELSWADPYVHVGVEEDYPEADQITPAEMALAESSIGMPGYHPDTHVLPAVTESWEEVFDPESDAIMGDRARIARAHNEALAAGKGLFSEGPGFWDQLRGTSSRPGRDAMRTTLEAILGKEAIAGLDFARGKGFHEWSQSLPTLGLSSVAIKMLGGLAGLLEDSPILGSVMVEGTKMNLHADGTLSEIPDWDTGDYDEGNIIEKPKRRYRSPQPKVADEAVKDPLEGVAKLLAERPTTVSGQEALQPQIDNLVVAGFSEEEALEMLGIG